MTSHLEDVPPPPYTETDIYSHSGGARSPISPVGHHRRDSSLGGADDATQSTSSTNGDVIYTPPLTPRSSHLSNFGGEADHLTVSSSAAYFDTRPAPSAVQNLPQVVHSITIHADSPSPGDLPYPAELASSRDIRVEDWQTFINYLLPHHTAAANEHIIDRKLRAEGTSDASSTASGHAEAQLDRIRGEQQYRAADASATVREWNEGFFAPRRVAIHLNVLEAEQQPRVQLPGAWDTSFDQPLPQGQAAPAPPAAGGRSRFSRFPFWGGGAGGSGGAGDARGHGNGGFRLGGIAVEGDRVSIGERFVADRNGVRIGGIVADTNGISVNGQPMFGGGPLPGGRGCHGAFGHQHGGWGGRGFGGPSAGPGPWGRGQFSDWARARGGGEAGAAPPAFGCGRGRGRGRGRRGCDDEERGFGRGRGRGHHAHAGRHRSRDSSVSSESSSSSSSSESSVDSLPDYDDLKDTQLPVARDYLQTWLNHPDQPVTKEKLKQAKEQIKQARNTPNTDPTNVTYDAKAMRKEIKAMIKEWKSLKKQQNRTRKQLRRERRQKRRDEKREWRNTKREMRRAEKEFRRGGGGHAQPPGFPFGAPAPPVPPVPAMVPMPPMHGVPPVPPVPSFMNMGMGMPRSGCAPHPMRATRSPPGPPWSPMGLGQLFGGWGGHTNVPGGQTQGTTNVGATTPGAWPGDNHGVDRHHEVSQAKYKAAMDIEARVIAKEAELLKLHEAIALEEEKKRTSGQSQKGDHKAQLGVEHGLETEIEELGRVMARLRTEADEEYARELAEEERRGGW